MAHRIVTFGSKLAQLVDVDGVQVSWPDKDLRLDNTGARIPGSGTLLQTNSERYGRINFVALAYDTDWDLVRIRPEGAGEALVLGPKRLLDLRDFKATTFEVQPHLAVPSTRMYNAVALRKYQRQSPPAPIAWTWVESDETGGQWRNDTGADVDVLRWDGVTHAWVFEETVAAGDVLSRGVAGLDNHGVADSRAADYSPDGGDWSFADYAEAGMVLNDAQQSIAGRAYISVADVDWRGNPGSNGAATTAKYAIFASTFADMSPLFYGRMRLEIWTDGDCPPAGYVPRLAPVRYVTLARQQLRGHQGGATEPYLGVLTVPAINVERAQYTFLVESGGDNAFVQLVEARADNWIDDSDGIADDDFLTVTAGDAGAAFLEEPTAAYIKIAAGTPGAASYIADRSLLAMVRREA
jgi:hypothetical protein